MRAATRSSAWWMAGLFLTLAMAVGLAPDLLGLGSARAQAAPKAPNIYETRIELERAGKVLSKATIGAYVGRPAQVTQGDSANPEGALRMQVEVTPNESNAARPMVDVKVTILEQVAGAWVILGEPTMRVLTTRPAEMSAVGVGGTTFRIKVTPRYSERAAKVAPTSCGAIDRPLGAPNLTANNCPNCPQLPCDGCPNCCRVPCASGPGNLTCCGGSQCCACDTCCDPPL